MSKTAQKMFPKLGTPLERIAFNDAMRKVMAQFGVTGTVGTWTLDPTMKQARFKVTIFSKPDKPAKLAIGTKIAYNGKQFALTGKLANGRWSCVKLDRWGMPTTKRYAISNDQINDKGQVL